MTIKYIEFVLLSPGSVLELKLEYQIKFGIPQNILSSTVFGVLFIVVSNVFISGCSRLKK